MENPLYGEEGRKILRLVPPSCEDLIEESLQEGPPRSSEWGLWAWEGLLFLVAIVFFLQSYLPNRETRLQLLQEWNEAQARVQRLERRIATLRLRCEAIEAEEKEALADVFRETLRQGEKGEYILPLP